MRTHIRHKCAVECTLYSDNIDYVHKSLASKRHNLMHISLCALFITLYWFVNMQITSHFLDCFFSSLASILNVAFVVCCDESMRESDTKLRNNDIVNFTNVPERNILFDEQSHWTIEVWIYRKYIKREFKIYSWNETEYLSSEVQKRGKEMHDFNTLRDLANLISSNWIRRRNRIYIMCSMSNILIA